MLHKKKTYLGAGGEKERKKKKILTRLCGSQKKWFDFDCLVDFLRWGLIPQVSLEFTIYPTLALNLHYSFCADLSLEET